MKQILYISFLLYSILTFGQIGDSVISKYQIICDEGCADAYVKIK
jgi:hypothetical protein